MSQYNDYDDYDYDSTDYYDGYDAAPMSRRSAPSKGRPSKKPIYKKWWFWLIVLLLLSGIGNAINGGNSPSDVSVSAVMETSTPEPTAEPTAEPTPEPEPTPTPEPTAEPTPRPEPTERMVYIPTKGGTKYHSNPGCSGMEDPEFVPVSEAEARGYEPCKKC